MSESDEQPIYSDQAPVIWLDDEEHPNLATDLVRFETHDDGLGLASLELVLLDGGTRGQDGLMQFQHEPGGPVELGAGIKLTLQKRGRDHTLFDGQITAIEGNYPEGNVHEILVRADDGLHQRRLRRRNRRFEQRTDVQIAADLGLDTSDAPTGRLPTHARRYQIQQTDLAFLRERAQAADARLEVVDGSARFVARDHSEQADPVPLTWGLNLQQFTASADLAHQRRAVEVHGFDASSGRPIHERATPDGSGVQLPDAGQAHRTGPGWLDEDGLRDWDAVDHLHLEFPITPREAASLARSRLRQRMDRFVTGSGETDGSPELRQGSSVRILGVNPRFEGTYRVSVVQHHFDQDQGLRTRFWCERAATHTSGRS